MGTHYFGDPNCAGNERAARISSSSSSSSRKGKKGSSEKPKQPQRGLGVAQLEKIRLHSQLGCNYFPASNFGHSQEDVRTHTAYSSYLPYPSSASLISYGYHGHHGVVMGLPDLNRVNAAYGDSQLSNIARVDRWHPVHATYDQHFVDARITRPFFNSEIEASFGNDNNNNDNDLMGPIALSNHKSESKQDSSKEMDLELRLSI